MVRQHNEDILVPAIPGPPGKWWLKWRESTQSDLQADVLERDALTAHSVVNDAVS